MTKDTPIDNINTKAQEEKNFLERVLDKVPGFSGYRAKEDRREADRMLRNTIVGRLDEIRLQLGSVHQELSRDIVKAMDHAEPLGEVDTRLTGLISKIRNAEEGYTGFFDTIKIDEEDLARVYHFDSGMMDHVDEIATAINELETVCVDGGDIAGSIRNANKAVKDANSTFASRDEVLKGL